MEKRSSWMYVAPTSSQLFSITKLTKTFPINGLFIAANTNSYFLTPASKNFLFSLKDVALALAVPVSGTTGVCEESEHLTL